MLKKDAEKFLPLIKAWSEGKTIEFYNKFDNIWNTIEDQNSIIWDQPIEHYRIKKDKIELRIINVVVKDNILGHVVYAISGEYVNNMPTCVNGHLDNWLKKWKKYKGFHSYSEFKIDISE